MRQSQSSLTAQGIAIMRALESELPAESRVGCDPYARQLVDSRLYWVAKLFYRLGYSEWRGPGVMGFLAARESHIDQVLRKCLAAGLEQLVLLGAGFDARAYRFADQLGGVAVFEVDHPATQRLKVARVKHMLGALPAHVAYVAVDFNTQSLGEQLAAAGYDPRRKTLFIWQGVTYYLTPEAVDGTLSFVACRSAPGSTIIFDYIYSTLLDGTVRHGEVRAMRHNRWLSGETFTFGISRGEAVDFMTTRGFCEVQDVDGPWLHAAYFTGPRSRRTVADGYGIVSGIVSGIAATS
jgi:methyltransferase (TIGR00027 family)